mmetsp:Transcript_30566/g.56486  ORF Transcript_30566/g.56486 Transcript_30566/m.56486 type:complete len:81 (-) Transcript_30566:2315-2557(-)
MYINNENSAELVMLSSSLISSSLYKRAIHCICRKILIVLIVIVLGTYTQNQDLGRMGILESGMRGCDGGGYFGYALCFDE